MGEAEIDGSRSVITIASHWVLYGAASDEQLAELVREETEDLWNEPKGQVTLRDKVFRVQFRISASHKPQTTEMEVLQSTDPRINFFRVEEFVHGNISFVDGLGCNTGYFKKENLYPGSTTAAHEYGHTLGLSHPTQLDIRGTGVPGIMYPRGTLVDAQYQYDPLKQAGTQGGTMHPMYRRVKQSDIDLLRLHKLPFENRKAIVGTFTNVFHWDHSSLEANDWNRPPFSG